MNELDDFFPQFNALPADIQLEILASGASSNFYLLSKNFLDKANKSAYIWHELLKRDFPWVVATNPKYKVSEGLKTPYDPTYWKRVYGKAYAHLHKSLNTQSKSIFFALIRNDLPKLKELLEDPEFKPKSFFNEIVDYFSKEIVVYSDSDIYIPRISVFSAACFGSKGSLLKQIYNKKQIYNTKEFFNKNQHIRVDRPLDDLERAACCGQIEEVKRIAKSFSPERKSKTEALILASQYRHTEVVETLLNMGFDVNACDGEGLTALHFACKSGQLEMVGLLSKHINIDLNSKDKSMRTPFQLACESGRVEVVEYILNLSEFDVNNLDSSDGSPLLSACKYGHFDVFKVLLKQCEVNINLKNSKGESALHWAAGRGHLQIVEKLLEQKDIDINLLTKFLGESALHWAARDGHLQIVEKLLKQKSIHNINRKNYHCESALHLAARRGHLRIVEKLLKQKNIDVNLRNKCGESALHLAVQNGHLRIVEKLLKQKNIDINLTNVRGESALHLAAKNGHLRIFKKLLMQENIHDINLTTNRGESALYIVCKNRRIDIKNAMAAIARELLKRDADVNLQDKKGIPTLAAACSGDGNTGMLTLLLKSNKLKDIEAVLYNGECSFKCRRILSAYMHNSEFLEKSYKIIYKKLVNYSHANLKNAKLAMFARFFSFEWKNHYGGLVAKVLIEDYPEGFKSGKDVDVFITALKTEATSQGIWLNKKSGTLRDILNLYDLVCPDVELPQLN